jgi:hypothetical protein
MEGIIDLDELLVKCRSSRARLFLTDAVACSRAGSSRGAIILCWTAVTYDLIDKIRQLAGTGDKDAESDIHNFDQIRRTNDVGRALLFERQLLTRARDVYALINHVEHQDLERIREDRNRCAHPTMTSDDEPYSPSPELARAHLRAAVTYLLSQPTAQGKYALSALLDDVKSPLFPMDYEKAKAWLLAGPMVRPKESLARNFIVLLLKTALLEDHDWRQVRAFRNALRVLAEQHAAICDATAKEQLGKIAERTSDTRLDTLIRLLVVIPHAWEYLGDKNQIRLNEYVRTLPDSELTSIDEMYDYSPLRAAAEKRIRLISLEQLNKSPFFFLPDAVCQHVVGKYLESKSYDNANAWGKYIVANVGDFQRTHLEAIIAGAAANGEITGSFEFPAVLRAIRSNMKNSERFDTLVKEHGLEHLLQ